jgi:predicted small secreted protein
MRMTKSLRILAIATTVCSLSSCNTFIGMGRDFQSLGNGMVNKGHGNTTATNPHVAAPAPVAPPAR